MGISTLKSIFKKRKNVGDYNIVYEQNVSIPAIAIMTIHIPKFHLMTLEPSSGGIGSKLNNARKLLILNPILAIR